MDEAQQFFLSYSRQDSEFALKLARDLRADGLPVWIDQLSLVPGRNWDRSIEAALNASAGVIVLLSPDSIKSDNVLDEVALAVDESKEILPVLLADCSIPLRLRRKQHIGFVGSDYASGLSRLKQALNKVITDGLHRSEEQGSLDGNENEGDRLSQGNAAASEANARQRPILTTASMAVLPLRRLTDDDHTRLIADGVHDEVSTSLSRIPTFHVVSSSTTRSLNVDGTTLRKVSREFGVRYAITGSLAVASGRVRVSVELEEIQSARVLWDERFEEEINDIFAVIDHITEAIVSRLHPHVYSAEIRRLGGKTKEEMTSWELVHRARMVRWSRSGLEESIELLRRSLELDADSALAHAELARALSNQAQWEGRIDLIGEINEHVKTAVKIDPNNPAALVASCVAYNNLGNYEMAYKAGQRACEINPNHADAWACAGMSLSGLGRPREAMDHIRRGIELSPRDPLLYVWHLFLTHANIIAGDRQQAVIENREAARLFPGNFVVHMTLAVNLASIGEYEEAREHWQEARRMFPDVSIDLFMAFTSLQKTPAHIVEADREAMEAAGFNLSASD
jgi:TolB-like protein